MSIELLNRYEKERIRLKAVTGRFLAVKEPSETFHMLMTHVFGMRAEINTLVECLSTQKKVEQDVYFRILIKRIQEQIDSILTGLPGVVCDEDGRLHGGTGGLIKPR